MQELAGLHAGVKRHPSAPDGSSADRITNGLLVTSEQHEPSSTGCSCAEPLRGDHLGVRNGNQHSVRRGTLALVAVDGIGYSMKMRLDLPA